jgi:hypothetical protein
LWRSNKSVFVAVVVFFFVFFLGLNLLVLQETSNAQQRSQRSMLTARQQTWLRQRPDESSVSIPTMHKMNHTSTTASTAVSTATTATASWQNKHNVVHVIQTRLFQFQPDFLTLGQARLEIFKAFTVPSMANQTTPDFLWIVRTDPALHPSLKSGLLAAVQHLDNVMVIASNYNPEGFRDYHAIANITNDQDSVWAGSWDLLKSYHDAAQTRMVVESRLDADDALSTEFCESVQQQVVEQLKDDKAWSVGCAEFHVEWQQYSPWNDTGKDKGALVGLASQKCVTPGLTFAYGGAASRADMPASAHHKIHSTLPACSEHQPTECLYRLSVPNKMPVAIRARTVTSAGMSSLFLEDAFGQKGLPKKLQQSSWRNIQDDLWRTLPPLCGLDASDIWKMRAFLKEHEKEIVTDNLKGQCTKGHSCKEESRAALKKLLETS